MITRRSIASLIATVALFTVCVQADDAATSEFTVHRLDDCVYYGAAPKNDCDFAQLQRLGIKRVVDVRTFKVFASLTERRRAAKFGISYQRIPTGFFPQWTGNVPRIMSQLLCVRGGAVYFHCNLGSDRTGMLKAIYRTEQFGWSSRTAFASWKEHQFNPSLKGLDRYYWQRVGTAN